MKIFTIIVNICFKSIKIDKKKACLNILNTVISIKVLKFSQQLENCYPIDRAIQTSKNLAGLWIHDLHSVSRWVNAVWWWFTVVRCVVVVWLKLFSIFMTIGRHDARATTSVYTWLWHAHNPKFNATKLANVSVVISRTFANARIYSTTKYTISSCGSGRHWSVLSWNFFLDKNVS